MKKKGNVLKKVGPILATAAVCVGTAIGFGTLNHIQGNVLNTPVSNANTPAGIMYSVLEIEPCWDYIYDEDSKKEQIAKALGVGKNQISFKCVSTAELNGMNEDFVASYDIIIMGTQTGTMCTDDSGKTIYNDRSLDGYIYLAYGDLVKYDDRMAGMLPYDYFGAIDSYVNNATVNGKKCQLNYSVKGTDGKNYTYSVDTTADTVTTNWKDKRYLYSMNNSAVWSPAMQNYFSKDYYILESINSKSWSSCTEYYNDSLGNARFTGNDITKKKVNEILDYVGTGRPIVLADELYTCVDDNAASANSNKSAYPTSNTYNLLKEIDNLDNVIKMSEISTKLAGVMHHPILEITTYTMRYQNASNAWVDAPNISYTNGILNDSCIIKDVNEFRYTVDFKATVGKQYFVKVIIDKDTNGKFNSVASVDDFNEVAYAKIVTAASDVMHQELNIKLAEGYNGMFGWQILVEELDSAKNPIDRVSVEGFTVVKGNEKHIKVLQLLPDANGALNMDSNTAFKDSMNTASGKIGYSVDVDTMNISTFESKFVGNKYTRGESYDTPADYLKSNGYNMLVIGFADSYNKEDISDDNGALSCVEDFIKNGNSVLFSHDTMQFQPSGNMGIAYSSVKDSGSGSNKKRTITLKLTNGWNERAGYIMTLRLRTLFGVDRYSAYTIPSYTDSIALEAANVPKKVDGSYITEIQGYTDFILLWLNIHNNYKTTRQDDSTIYTLPPNKNVIGHTDYSKIRTTRVEEINKGQINMYPYDVTDTGFLNVDRTHSQYFQLDLEDDDIVVWYTLTDDSSGNGKLYSAMSRDAANNYYIYSKGNITYTGAGHSSGDDVSGGDFTINGTSEIRLFVNTVIRAASAGNFEPEVALLNGYATTEKDHYVLNPQAYASEILVQFRAFDEDLATKEVIKDSYPEAEWKDHIGRFDSGAIYWVDKDGVEHTLKTYSRDDKNSYLLNGEVTEFTIYNPLDKGYTMAQINGNSQLKAMYGCYQEYSTNGITNLRIEATDYYNATKSCYIEILEQELFDLD